MIVSVGIDPGLNGAVVVINMALQLLDWYDCPTIELKKGKRTNRQFAVAEMTRILKTILEAHGHHHMQLFLEKAGAQPKQGLASTFKTGYGFGLWEGMLPWTGKPYAVIHPNKWTRTVLKGLPPGDPKERSMINCQRLFPDLPLVKPRGKVLSLDGRADAANVAYYGLMHEMVKPTI